MDLNNSFGSEKSRNESVRVPSPASVSSVHSIRPLEWDSGADIGYELKQQSDLSTVERIALKSGTVNLLENCITHSALSDRFYSKRYLGNPVAQSSPFAAELELVKIDAISPNTSDDLRKPLVNYSVTEYSIDETVENFESEVPIKVDVLEKPDRVLKLRNNESSKSLDDLRYLGRDRYSRTKPNNRSRSSQNLVLNALKSSSGKNSSSSSATLVPPTDENRVRRYSNKSVQVDEICLITDQNKRNEPSESNLEFFRKICDREQNEDDSRNTSSKKGSNSENDEGSVDKGSFEYVPGSRYASQTLESKSSYDIRSKDASSVNTLCSEVTDGVALLTRYVNDLKISHKRQVMEKVAKSLMNHLNDLDRLRKSSRWSRTKSRGNDLLLSSSPELRAKGESYSLREPNSVRSNSTSNLKIDSKSSSSNYLESRSSTTNNSRLLVTSDGFSSKDSSRMPASLNSRSYSFDAATSSRIDLNSDSNLSNTRKDGASPQFHNFKEYLKKERDAQLLWIKSNIDHLKSLKKLYESEKSLQNELITLRKGALSCPARETSQTDVSERYSPSKRRVKSAGRHRCVRKPQKISSDLTSSNTTSCDNLGVLSTLENVRRMSRKISSSTKNMNFKERKQTETVIEQDLRESSCRSCCRKSNKENTILDSTDGSKRSEKSAQCRKSKDITSSKPPISYTILFDKGPNFRAHENFKVKEYYKRKCISRVTDSRKRIRRTRSVTELRSSSTCQISNQPISLQEYLINNKPEYVNRADYRRQCLAEIAKLRELRDKSREELLSAVRNVDEVNIGIKSVAVPPPLSVVRLFDDRTIKKETEKKYQQLPEVQNKKLEMKRKDTYRRNHIMAKVFTKKLQRKVLKGQVNLANNVNILSL